MNFHYALVDDVVTREEFERRVEEKVKESGGLLDEDTAAILVVKEYGRNHVKIRDIAEKASLYCFFGKIISYERVREFGRPDGTRGMVSKLIVGDETGLIPVMLWDDRAMAVDELECGEVLEIIGKPSKTGNREVHGLNLRKTTCDIPSIHEQPTGSVIEKENSLEACILGLDPPREFNRPDGSTSVRVEGLAGNERGTFKVVCWAPELVKSLLVPSSVYIRGVREKRGRHGIEYHIDARSSLTSIEREMQVPFTPISNVEDGGVFSLQGLIKGVENPRQFIRKGSPSYVRNVRISDDTGSISLVIWGEKALQPLLIGDQVHVYHVQARRNHQGEMELHTMRGSIIRVILGEPTEIEFAGTIIPGLDGIFIDNGREIFLVEGDLPIGANLRLKGIAYGRRIVPSSYEPMNIEKQDLLAQLDTL